MEFMYLWGLFKIFLRLKLFKGRDGLAVRKGNGWMGWHVYDIHLHIRRRLEKKEINRAEKKIFAVCKIKVRGKVGVVMTARNRNRNSI